MGSNNYHCAECGLLASNHPIPDLDMDDPDGYLCEDPVRPPQQDAEPGEGEAESALDGLEEIARATCEDEIDHRIVSTYVERVRDRLRTRVPQRTVSREDAVMDALGGPVATDSIDAEASRRVFEKHAHPVRPKVSQEAVSTIEDYLIDTYGDTRAGATEGAGEILQALGLQIEGEE